MKSYKPKTLKANPKPTKTITADEAGKLGNFECRKAVYAFLADKGERPSSTKDVDLVPVLEGLIGPAPDDIDDINDAYVWMVLTLVDTGKLKLPSLAFKAWSKQSRVKLVRNFMDEAKAETEDNEE